MPWFGPSVDAVSFSDAVQVLLASQRVVPQAAMAHGFAFRFAELEPALRDVLGRR